jgi:hypothetical protein
MVLTTEAFAQKLGLVLRMHSQAAAATELTSQWVASHQALGGPASPRQVHRWRFGDLAAAMFPDAALSDVVLAADLTHWIAVVDDTVEKDPSTTELLRTQHHTQHTSHLVAAWLNLKQRLNAGQSVQFAERLEQQFERLFDAYRWEARFRELGTVPKMNEFSAWRWLSGGLPLYFLILERATGDAPLHGLTREACDQRIGNLACWANDLLSYEFDTETSNPVNLVRVVEMQMQVGRVEAMKAAVEAFEATWRDWQALTAADEALKRSRYVAWQPAFIAGTLMWMGRTQRYGEVPSP